MTSSQSWGRSPWFSITPPLPPDVHVDRPRLSDLLDEATRTHRVTFVTAPAGYGKSTALAGWARRRADPVSWLTLSRLDVDPTRLLRGVASALQGNPAGDGSLAADLPATPQDESGHRDTFDAIVSWVARQQTPLCLVIDDIHLTDLTSDSALGLLVDHGPDQLRLVLGGRDLDRSSARRTAYRHAAMLGPAELKFTPDEVVEAARLLNRDLAHDAAASLVERVGGWPVAIRLGLEGGLHPGPTAPRDGLANDGLADLIEAEILGENALAEFLLASTTSTMVDDRLAADLSGRDDAGALLAECVRRGLFIDRFHSDDAPDVYRWHDVFVSACQDIVRRRSLAESRRLHRIAATRLAIRFPLEAARHALEADDPELGAEIVQRTWPHLVVTSDTKGLLTTCLSLPEPWCDQHEVLLIRSCCLALRGDTVGAKLLRSRAHDLGDDESTDRAIAAALTDLLTADEHAVRVSACDRLRTLLASDHHLTPRSVAAALFMVGWAEVRLRLSPRRTIGSLRAALAAAQACDDADLARRAAVNLVLAEVLAGRFTESYRLTEGELAHVLRDSDWQWFDDGVEGFSSGMRAFWQADYALAEESLRQVVTRLDGTGMVGAMSRIFRALAACAAKDLPLVDITERGLAELDPQETYGLPWASYLATARAAIAEARGRIAVALELASTVQRTEYLPAMLVIVAEIQRRHGRLRDAEATLAVLKHRQMPSYVEATILVTEAVAHRTQGRFVVAHRLLERALDLIRSESILRAINLDDPALRALLAEHASWGSGHEIFLAEVLAGHDPMVPTATTLSHREKEILAYLRTTMSVAEIAATLHVSVNTVKTHQRAIYRKLGVTSRRDAVGMRV